MKYYPVCLDLRGRTCVVAGGGLVAERKAGSLLKAGAAVVVVSPSLTPGLRELSSSGRIVYRPGTFGDDDVQGACLVIAATDSPEVNSAIARLCSGRQVLVNVAAPPEESTFIVPSVVERGDLLIAVSSSGASPALSRKIRCELAETYGPEYALFLERLAAVRGRLLKGPLSQAERQAVFQALVDSDILELLRQGKTQEADRRIAEFTGLRES